MWDEFQRLRENDQLAVLLEHYVRLTTEDREAWLDRCMQLDGVEAKGLAELHGLLIAFGWIEQNTGQMPVLQAAGCPGCYRTTAAGRRALQRHRAADDEDERAAA
jgi:hypothetical protein